MIETLQSLFEGFLDWLAQVILPDWNDVITWIPALLMGLVGLILLMRRWSRRSASAAPATPVDPDTRERIRREMADLES